MGDICRRGTLFFFFFCGVIGGLLPVVGQRTPLLSRQHLVTGQKLTQSEQVCANALQSKVGIPSVLRFLHILFIFIDIMDSRKATNPFPISGSAGLWT